MASNKSIPPPLTLLPTSPPRPVTPTAVESKRKPQLIKEGMDSIDIDGNDMPKQPTLRPFTAAESKCNTQLGKTLALADFYHRDVFFFKY